MKTFLQYVLIVTSVLIIIFVLMQNQGFGLGAAFGGETSFYRTKRGVERVLFYGTMILIIVFVICLVTLLTIK